MFRVSTRGYATRAFLYLSALLIALSYTIVALVSKPDNVFAAEVQERSITMGTSEADAETTYTVQFDLATAGELGAIVVEFCNNHPLPNQTCTNTAVGDDAPEIDGTGAGSVVTLNLAGTTIGSTVGECADAALTLDTIANSDRALLVTCTATETFVGGETITLQFDNVDNPDNTTSGNNNDTFYARIYTYSTVTPPDPNTNNPVLSTNQVDTGGIAMSTAEQLTITARVQEILEFCVGTQDAGDPAPADCSAQSGNAIDLGVLDFSSVTFATDTATDNQGSILVRTNASNGVVVDYFAEQASTGSNHLGALRVSGATCNGGVVVTDQCINSVGTTQDQILAGTEEFGICTLYDNSSSDAPNTTNNLSRDADYDGLCDNSSVANGFAFDETGTTDTLAASTTVVNEEGLAIEFAGTSSVTTPTGLYTTTLTFIGTATF